MGKILKGAPMIGEHLQLSKHAASRLLVAGRIPAKKLGGVWVTDSDLLDREFRGEGVLAETKQRAEAHAAKIAAQKAARSKPLRGRGRPPRRARRAADATVGAEV